jgi:hypothetical protein
MPNKDPDTYGEQWNKKEDEEKARQLKEQAEKDRLAREANKPKEEGEH